MTYVDYRDKIKATLNQGWNIRDDLKDMPLEAVQGAQRAASKPYAVCVVNVLGDLNVGNILRSAVCFGAEKFFIIGRRKFDRRSAVGAQNYIELVRIDALDEEKNFLPDVFFSALAEHGYTPYAFETDGMELRGHCWGKIYRPCLIFGNEGLGIPEAVLDRIPDYRKVRIDQVGVLRSLNVSVAAGIAMDHIHRQVI